MAYLYLIPNWFFGFGVAMEILFGVVAAAVAGVSFYLYHISREKALRHLGVAFLLIALSYGIWASMNIFVASTTHQEIREVSLENLALLGTLGFYAHMILFVSGLVTLTYITFKLKKGGVYYVMLGLSLLVLAASVNKLITFRILSIFLLSFIIYHYFFEWKASRNQRTLQICISLFLLLCSNIDFLFVAYYYPAFIIGHFVELGAYLLMLLSLMQTIKR